MARPIPPPSDLAATPRDLFAELERHVGTAQAARWCAGYLDGADPRDLPDVFPYFGARGTDAFLEGWWGPAYWSRVWGARGLLYVWDDSCAPSVVAGLGDEAWRVAEMCVKVSAKREIGEAGSGAAALAGPRAPAGARRRWCERSAGSVTPSTSASSSTPSTTTRPAFARQPPERLELLRPPARPLTVSDRRSVGRDGWQQLVDGVAKVAHRLDDQVRSRSAAREV